jgi:surface protein
MAIKFGNASISKIYLGSNEISKAYLGSNEVFSSGDTTTFITTWRTTTSNETITIPTTGGGYNYNIITSDGQEFTGLTGSHTITFANAGDYDVSISGDFPRIYINNGVDKDKIIDIKQWGNIVWTNFLRAFYGCSNLVGSFTDAPNLANVTTLQDSFRNCSSFSANLSSWDVSNVKNFTNTFIIFGGGVTAPSTPVSGLGSWDMSSAVSIGSMFREQTNYNEDLSSWDVSNVNNMLNVFWGSTSFDQDLSNWNIINVTDFSNFARNIAFSTSNYDAILIGWESTLQGTYPNGSGYTPTISISFGSSKYTSGGAAAAARASLVSNFGWTITDGGSI